jgi:hypothetical protein
LLAAVSGGTSAAYVRMWEIAERGEAAQSFGVEPR